MGNDGLGGGGAVTGHGGDVSAGAVEKAVHLAERMVETARAGPTIGTPENGFVAMGPANPIDLPGSDIQGLVPWDLHEFVFSPACVPEAGFSGAVLQPAAPDAGPHNAGSMVHRRGQHLGDRGG